MKKNNKIIILMMSLILLLSSLNTVSFASSDSIKIVYFGVDACISCVKAEKHIESLMSKLKSKDINIELVTYNIINKDDEELLVRYNNYFDIKDDKYKLIPAVFLGEVALIGDEDIVSNLEDTIMLYHYNPSDYVDVDASNTSKSNKLSLTTMGIVLAGLMDGINPCSIAMMLFFISFLFMSKEDLSKKKVLFLGFSFALGTFIAYFGIGIGLFRFIYRFSNMQAIMKMVYLLLFIMGVYLACINTLDYINIKKGKDEKIRNQLNKNTKKKIHNIIKKFNSNNKVLYATAFTTALVISFLEFFCTGQVYLPVITYMIKNSQELNYVMFLILYNIAFISPLLLITILICLGKEVIDVSTILVTKLHLVKLVGAIFFSIVAIYSLLQVFLM